MGGASGLSCGSKKCKNRSNTNKDVSFHRIPGTQPDWHRSVWEILLQKGREGEPPSNLYMCNVHFTQDCFHQKGKPISLNILECIVYLPGSMYLYLSRSLSSNLLNLRLSVIGYFKT